jgi:2-oxo-4-hydroxy-4-carboxy--5-ureidoimidazoline (OHCU) decarboxylase
MFPSEWIVNSASHRLSKQRIRFQVAEMHSMLAEYHRKLAKEARLDIVRDYHVDIAQRLTE